MTRFASEDRSVDVAVEPLGVSVSILGHRWHWIISSLDGSLRLQGGTAPAPEGHDSRARRPEECPGCQPFLAFTPALRQGEHPSEFHLPTHLTLSEPQEEE